MSSLNEFILMIVEKLNELTSHSFIAKGQVLETL